MSDQRPSRPASFDQSVRAMGLTPEDEARLEARKSMAADRGLESAEDLDALEDAESEGSALEAAAEEPDGPEIPPWVVVPEGLRIPDGRSVAFLRFPSVWTTKPGKGLVWDGREKEPAYQGKRHRQCILWTLSIADEKLARVASRGDPFALVGEMAKRQIRAIDGCRVDWTTGNVNRATGRRLGVGEGADAEIGGSNESHVPTFWEEIGAPLRSVIVTHYNATHSLDRKQREHFFLNCYVVRRAETG